tara:strand:- start:850 stop:1329 length:480 start_codon:yes stop_codon:yes gene_type:complete
MFKNLFLTFFLFFSFFITIYPSKKENTNLTDYCYSLEKILSRNSINNSKNISFKYDTFAKDITLFGTKKTKGDFVNMIIDQYKISKKSFTINLVPNKLYCFVGYWTEELNPGKLQSIFYKKSKEKINKYKNIKKEIDLFIKDINSEYNSIEKEIKDFLY